jgi:hypothetical protein
MSELLNPIAELDSVDSGKIIQPEYAHRIRELNKFFCPDYDCRDPKRKLFVRRRENGRPHFYHAPDCEHEIRPETLLHKLAIQWFVDKVIFEVPGFSSKDKKFDVTILHLNGNETIPEYSKLARIKPDVKLCTINGFHLAIEIVVTHDVDENKRKLIHEFGLPTIRIDLSYFYKRNQKQCQINPEFVKMHLDELLTDINFKSWVVAPNLDEITDDFKIENVPKSVAQVKPQPSNGDCLSVIALLIATPLITIICLICVIISLL